VKEDIMYQYDVTFKETGELPWTIRLNNFRMTIFHANRPYSAVKERYRKETDLQGRSGSSGQAGRTVLMQEKARLGNGNNPVIDSGGLLWYLSASSRVDLFSLRGPGSIPDPSDGYPGQG
jgi:hypothetical protein